MPSALVMHSMVSRCHKGQFALLAVFALQFMSAPPSDVLSSDLTVVAPPIPGRKCYKKTKERKEAIWAPKLEGALVEGLPGSFIEE